MKIKFSNTLGLEDIFPPVPAATMLPTWYKEMNSYINNEKKYLASGTPATIKKCMPVFDVLTAGYFILLSADVQVEQLNGEPYYRWLTNSVDFHPVEQVSGHPEVKKQKNVTVVPKWVNKWIVQTPKGYSSLFINPVHRDSPFRILEGIVDTDTYYNPVNFPFILKDSNWTGIIPAGTPIAQVIPFKRDKFEMITEKVDTYKYTQVLNKILFKFFNAYKDIFWNKKEYK